MFPYKAEMLKGFLLLRLVHYAALEICSFTIFLGTVQVGTLGDMSVGAGQFALSPLL